MSELGLFQNDPLPTLRVFGNNPRLLVGLNVFADDGYMHSSMYNEPEIRENIDFEFV